MIFTTFFVSVFSTISINDKKIKRRADADAIGIKHICNPKSDIFVKINNLRDVKHVWSNAQYGHVLLSKLS